MARYVICTTEVVEVEHDREEPVHRPPVLCETRGEAEGELARVWDDHDRDWSVWEMVNGRAQRRSVVFKDGKPESQS